MEIIAFHNCADSYEARKKEQEYFEALGATLNSIDPFPKPKIKEPSLKIVKDKKILFCEPCNVHFAHWKTQETHNHTKKHHKMVAMHIPNELEQDNIHKNTTSNSSIIPSKFVCDKCHYSTSRNSQYERHILTDKHIRISQATLSNAEATPKMTKCENCNKVYRDRTGLWRHKKNCIPGTNNHAYSDNPATIETIANTSNKDELINCLMKEIQEFKQLILEIVKKGHI